MTLLYIVPTASPEIENVPAFSSVIMINQPMGCVEEISAASSSSSVSFVKCTKNMRCCNINPVSVGITLCQPCLDKDSNRKRLKVRPVIKNKKSTFRVSSNVFILFRERHIQSRMNAECFYHRKCKHCLTINRARSI